MKRDWWYRLLLLVFLTGISVFMIVPTAFDFKEGNSYPYKGKVNLGLDLQGGLYMILGIDFNKVYLEEVKGIGRKIQYVLKDNGIDSSLGNLNVDDPEDPKQMIILADGSQVELAKQKVGESYNRTIRLTFQDASGKLEYGLNDLQKTDIQEQAVTKSIEVIRNRIDEFGVTEPEIISQGKDRIVVQLPGVKDIDRAKGLIGKTAKLEFKMVKMDLPATQLNQWVEKAETAGIKYEQGKDRFSDYILKLNQHLKNDLPKGFEIVFQKEVNKFTNKIDRMIPFVVESSSRLTGDEIEDAFVAIDQQNNMPYVALSFKNSGAKTFENLTAENVGKLMAIVLDGNVYSAPRINERIGGGRASITLGGSYNQALKEGRDLALVLKAGALPVQLDFEEQRIVGPSLGSDSIKSAKLASLIGCGLVFLFLLFYYKIAGIVAVTTLLLNALFVFAALVSFEATLTLPGIAGIALTIGMAVDANIIIYERIREELRRGSTKLKSVSSGFSSAFWTILDANITTALAGFCLVNFGTGPIRGFAVTLLIGIIATVYTSYFVSKLLFEFYMDKVSGRDLSI